MKRISDKDRLNLAKLFLLVDAALKVDPRVNAAVAPEVHSRAKNAVVDFARAIGMKTENNLDDSYYEVRTVRQSHPPPQHPSACLSLPILAGCPPKPYPEPFGPSADARRPPARRCAACTSGAWTLRSSTRAT